MVYYKNEIEFLDSIKSSNVVSGKFKFNFGGDSLMDLELKNIRFENCEIFGGNFASSVFRNCVFDKVLFRETVLVGLVFHKCDFIDCKLSNVESDFTVENCKIRKLRLTQETLNLALHSFTKE